MPTIILNPESGAPIKNVQVLGQILFKDKPFEVDSLRKIEKDAIANDLLKLFGFLIVLTVDEAKTYVDNKAKRKFKCEKCSFATEEAIALAGHSKKHEKEEKIDKELGIEVIAEQEVEQVSNEELEKRRAEAEKRHLENMGITAQWEDEAPNRGVRM